MSLKASGISKLKISKSRGMRSNEKSLISTLLSTPSCSSNSLANIVRDGQKTSLYELLGPLAAFINFATFLVISNLGGIIMNIYVTSFSIWLIFSMVKILTTPLS